MEGGRERKGENAGERDATIQPHTDRACTHSATDLTAEMQPRAPRSGQFRRRPNRAATPMPRAPAAVNVMDTALRARIISITGMCGPSPLTSAVEALNSTAAVHTHSTPEFQSVLRPAHHGTEPAG